MHQRLLLRIQVVVQLELVEQRAAVVQHRIVELLLRLDAALDRWRADSRRHRHQLARRRGDQGRTAPQHDPGAGAEVNLRAQRRQGLLERRRQIPGEAQRAVEGFEAVLGERVVERVLKAEGGERAVGQQQRRGARGRVPHVEADEVRLVLTLLECAAEVVERRLDVSRQRAAELVGRRHARRTVFAAQQHAVERMCRVVEELSHGRALVTIRRAEPDARARTADLANQAHALVVVEASDVDDLRLEHLHDLRQFAKRRRLQHQPVFVRRRRIEAEAAPHQRRFIVDDVGRLEHAGLALHEQHARGRRYDRLGLAREHIEVAHHRQRETADAKAPRRARQHEFPWKDAPGPALGFVFERHLDHRDARLADRLQRDVGQAEGMHRLDRRALMARDRALVALPALATAQHIGPAHRLAGQRDLARRFRRGIGGIGRWRRDRRCHRDRFAAKRVASARRHDRDAPQVGAWVVAVHLAPSLHFRQRSGIRLRAARGVREET